MELRKINCIIAIGVALQLLSACGDGGDSTNNMGNTIINGDVGNFNSESFNNNPTLIDESASTAQQQTDCRIPEIVRLAFENPGLALVQFPESVLLPSQSGLQRRVQIPEGNSLYIDSIIVDEIGTISVTHSGEGPQHTVMELFELDVENRVVSIVGSGMFNEFTGRAGVDIALLSGIYCFYIADAAGAFAANTVLSVDFLYTP